MSGAIDRGEPPEPEQKLHLRPNTEGALREYIERARRGQKPNYKIIAMRWGISEQTIKSAACRWRGGLIELGESKNAEDKAIDKRVEMERSLKSLDRLEMMLNDVLIGLIEKAAYHQSQGKLHAYQDVGIPRVLTDMNALTRLRNLKEQGFLAILQAANREKQAKSATDVVTEVTRKDMTDEQRARESLQQLLREKGVPEGDVAEVIEATDLRSNGDS